MDLSPGSFGGAGERCASNTSESLRGQAFDKSCSWGEG